MDIKTKNGGFAELTAAEGCFLHRKNSDSYQRIRRATVNNPDEWEDIAEADIPPYTKEEYDAKVNELVRRRYSESEEFAIQRKMLNAILPQPATLSEEDSAVADAEKAMTEYAEYNAYVEQCKADAPERIAEDKAVADRELPTDE